MMDIEGTQMQTITRSGTRQARRVAALAIAAAILVSACDGAGVALWPFVEKEDPAEQPATDTASRPPPPPPPLTPGDPLDPDAPPPVVPNPAANSGAPDGGTPFIEAPVNEAIPISDSTAPVSAETGQPVTLPLPTETGGSGPTEAPAPDPTPAPGADTTPDPTPTPAPGPDPAPAPSPAPAAPPVTPSFFFFPAGSLETGSGTGTTDASVLVPDMVFPIKDAPAFPQSQVYRFGGGVKGGDQCDARNFAAPWRDNFCERRSTENTTIWCAIKGVHLGQDIRVGTPEGCRAERSAKAIDRTRYAVVAVDDGVISNVGSYSVSLRGNGRIYRYLHLNMAKLSVQTGQSVKKGDLIGYVSNDFGGTPTTLHLHFEIKLNTAENGWQFAPPYSSLVAAYQRRENNPGEMVVEGGTAAISSAPR
jgi:hypothetical protein